MSMETIVTEDGQRVGIGSRVFDYYGLAWGVVVSEPDSAGWVDVEHDSGRRVYLDGSRMSTYEPVIRPADGSIDGYAWVCGECEDRRTSSLLGLLREDVAQHVARHAENAGMARAENVHENAGHEDEPEDETAFLTDEPDVLAGYVIDRYYLSNYDEAIAAICRHEPLIVAEAVAIIACSVRPAARMLVSYLACGRTVSA